MSEREWRPGDQDPEMSVGRALGSVAFGVAVLIALGVGVGWLIWGR